MKHKTFYEAIYGAWVDFIWGYSASELKKYIGNKYDYVDNDTETFAGAVVRVTSAGKDGLKKGTPVYVLWVAKADMDYLDHEVMHLAASILGDCGVKYEPDNDEHFVYYKVFWMGVLKREMRKRCRTQGKR